MTVHTGPGVIDADGHYYETDDAFTRHIEPAFRHRAVNIRRGDDGLGRIYVGDERLTFMSVTPMDYVQPPGSLRPFLLGEVDRGAIADQRLPCDAAYQDRGARLALMDVQGVEATIMFPTLAVVVEHQLHDDVPALQANLRAFNRWLEDDWGWAHEDRIFAAPLLSLTDVGAAIAELERVLAAGARLVHLKSGPVYGRSPADPVYDPFWARVSEAGIPVAFHAGDSGYNELVSAQWGERGRVPSRLMTSFQMLLMHSRPIVDTIAALVLHGLFDRFPTLRVLSIEQGSSWVPGLLADMDAAFRFHPGTGTTLPSDTFRRNIWVSPFHEEDVAGLAACIGAGHVLFGSDFPHPEGVAEPRQFVECLAALDQHDTDRIMRGNTAELLGLQVPAAAQ